MNHQSPDPTSAASKGKNPGEFSFDNLVHLSSRVLNVSHAFVGSKHGDTFSIEAWSGVNLDSFHDRDAIFQKMMAVRETTIIEEAIWASEAVPESMQFVAAIPFSSRSGSLHSTLVLFDEVSHSLDKADHEILRCLADVGADMLDSRSAWWGSEEGGHCRALEASEERFRHAIENALDGIIAMDVNGLITGWNRQAEEIFGWTREEVIGRSVADTIVPPSYYHAHCKGFANFMATGNAHVLNRRVELFGLRRDLTEFPLEIAITSVGQGANMSFVAFTRDITDRRLAEAALREAKEEAERANRGKSEFLSRMSHELRTPLNAIVGFTQLLQFDDLGESGNEGVGHIAVAGQHLLKLINEVLDIARIEAGEMAVDLERVDIAVVLEDVIPLVQPIAAQRSVRLFAEGLELKTFAYADAHRVRQVLLNLLSNGIKYNRQGGALRIRFYEEEKTVSVCVSDEGHGIPKELLGRLFTPFDRLGVETSGVEGSGLGLTLAKRMVESMGGTLTVSSIVEEGSSFIMSLPKAEGSVSEHFAGDGSDLSRWTA